MRNIWAIKKIEVFSEKLKSNKILNFENNSKDLFSLVFLILILNVFGNKNSNTLYIIDNKPITNIIFIL